VVLGREFIGDGFAPPGGIAPAGDQPEKTFGLTNEGTQFERLSAPNPVG
jgi:hypothetical protein